MTTCGGGVGARVVPAGAGVVPGGAGVVPAGVGVVPGGAGVVPAGAGAGAGVGAAAGSGVGAGAVAAAGCVGAGSAAAVVAVSLPLGRSARYAPAATPSTTATVAPMITPRLPTSWVCECIIWPAEPPTLLWLPRPGAGVNGLAPPGPM